MAGRSTVERWLGELANLPTASGREDAVISWARAWAGRRADLVVRSDSGGNLLITQKGRRRDPVLAVAHMDHPAFVIGQVSGGEAAFEFRGGVRAEYFPKARVEFVTGHGGGGEVITHDPATGTGTILYDGRARPVAGDLARWAMSRRKPAAGMFAGPACDDLAGCAAALAALDRARGNPEMRHFAVLLTRAEEVGFIGAIHAAKSGLIPTRSRLLSIEASRTSSEAPVGGGPVVRVGDASTVFDRELVNLISRAAASSGVAHQRKLMAGGSCEATAFGAYGYRAAGLCLPLGNYHNMGNLDEVERGSGPAVPELEVVSLADVHGLVDLLLVACMAVDGEDVLQARLDDLYEGSRHLLG
jgi:endoglucanase